MLEDQSGKWIVTLRRQGLTGQDDYWWQEKFDALVVASGHLSVLYIPAIKGLKEFAAAYPRSVLHTKGFRHPETYRGKVNAISITMMPLSDNYQRVVTVDASVSGADTAVSLIGIAKMPINAVVRGRYNDYFGDEAFKHPKIKRQPLISRISERTIHFEDGTSLPDVDYIIFGAGYTWTLPFLPHVATRSNRVPDLYLHVFHGQDLTLVFIGAVCFILLHTYQPR